MIIIWTGIAFGSVNMPISIVTIANNYQQLENNKEYEPYKNIDHGILPNTLVIICFLSKSFATILTV